MLLIKRCAFSIAHKKFKYTFNSKVKVPSGIRNEGPNITFSKPNAVAIERWKRIMPKAAYKCKEEVMADHSAEVFE